MLKIRYQLFALGAIVLAVYSPSIFAEFCNIDDAGMVASVLGRDNWTLEGIFTPRRSGALYFRPLVILSYFLDREIWGMHPVAMHLENILLHLGNALLVFFLTRQLLPENLRKRSFVPIFAALLFALHPVNSESVVWVSGRTDLLAGFFVLLGVISLVRFKTEKGWAFLLLGFISLFGGVITKETAFALVPGALLILLARRFPKDQGEEKGFRKIVPIIKWTIIVALGFAGAVVVFRLLRGLAITSDSLRIGRTLQYMFSDLYYTTFVFLRAFGFYIKKLLWPFPLSFAIIEVDPLYELFAIPVVLICIFVAMRRTLLSGIFIAGIFMITPALPIAFGQIAWTPYSERYVYITSSLILPVLTLFLATRLEKVVHRRTLYVLFCFLLVMMGAATFQRSLVWQSNVTLLADTVRKSPNFAPAWSEYGVALYRNGDPQTALLQFEKARNVYSFAYNQKYDLNLAAVLIELGREGEAFEVYQGVISKTQGETPKGYDGAIELLEKQLSEAQDLGEIDQINSLLLQYTNSREELKVNPPKRNRLWRF
jgi:hypothetical protein